MHEWMNGWMDGFRNEWMEEWNDGWDNYEVGWCYGIGRLKQKCTVLTFKLTLTKLEKNECFA